MPTTTDDVNRIGSTVRRLRAERGMRQQELATAANLTVRTIQAVEGAEYRAHDSTLGRIASALGVRLAELLGEES